MDPRLNVIRRLQPVLWLHLGVKPDTARLLGDTLYTRDVLLVCDAFTGTELPQIAREFREAEAAAARPAEPPAPGPAAPTEVRTAAPPPHPARRASDAAEAAGQADRDERRPTPQTAPIGNGWLARWRRPGPRTA